MNTVMIYRDGEAMPAIRLIAHPHACRLWMKAVLLLAIVLMALDARADVPSPASFDKNTLQQRGIDPALATLLLAAPSFPAGRHPLTLSVNGQRQGRVDVRFNRDGTLCFDRDLLDAANLGVPEQLVDAQPANDTPCHDVLGTWPQTVVDQDPANLALSLIVPGDALRPVLRDVSGY